MARQRVTTSLGVVLAFACAANAGFAQTQATTTNGAQTSGGQGQSAAALAQEASNPFATSWLMQLQQNNNWTEMPRGDDHTRVQSNLVFQPLMSLRLTEKQGLIIRPMVTIVNSIPHFDQSGQNERTAGFGDTVLAFALPRSLLGGRLTVGAGPTFIFPTASKDLLSQDTWQVGPDAGAALLGKNFIAYAFVQQWFKVGGDGEDTNHMNGTFNFTYMLANGFTIGTQPNLSVDWEAPEDNRVAFSIGPQIGKLCRCGGLPTLFQVQVQYLPRSSGRRRPEVEHSAASDSDDSGPHQESALLTGGQALPSALSPGKRWGLRGDCLACHVANLGRSDQQNESLKPESWQRHGVRSTRRCRLSSTKLASHRRSAPQLRRTRAQRSLGCRTSTWRSCARTSRTAVSQRTRRPCGSRRTLHYSVLIASYAQGAILLCIVGQELPITSRRDCRSRKSNEVLRRKHRWNQPIRRTTGVCPGLVRWSPPRPE